MSRRLGATQRERGAALVEMAIVTPLLVLLLLGTIEFGWGLAQQIDVRHKAREALRLAIVDGTETEVVNRVCSGDIVAAADITELSRSGGTEPADPVTVSVEANLRQITGFFTWVWGPSPTIASTVEGRVEQEAEEWLPGVDLESSC